MVNPKSCCLLLLLKSTRGLMFWIPWKSAIPLQLMCEPRVMYLVCTFLLAGSMVQTLSFTFNKDGLLTCFTGGYVLDRRMGNTGGLGGVFGLMHGIGWTLPFPEGQPFRLSWRYRIFLWLESVMRFVSSLLATRPTMGSKGE